MDPMLAFALPGGALVFAVAGFVVHKLSMQQFNRKHPHLRRGFDREDADQLSIKPATGTMSASEASDELQADMTVSANQNALWATSRPRQVFDTVLMPEAVETLKRAGLVVSSVPPGTFGGQVRGHSNILPPRSTPRSRKDEGAPVLPDER